MINKKYEKHRLKIIADNVKGRTVLDIGHSQLPNSYLSKYETIGYDKNLSKHKNKIYSEEIQGDIKDIKKELHGRRFDTIICAETIEHLEKPYDFLRDLKNLLDKNGRLIITTPNPLGFPIIFYEMLCKKNRFYDKDHKYIFTPRWIERMLNISGFKLLKIKPVGLWCYSFYIPIYPCFLSYQIVYIVEKN